MTDSTTNSASNPTNSATSSELPPPPSYDASNIQVLEGLEAVRKRPGMYIGSTGERGLHHLVTEVVDNSVDEALAGYCSLIDVTLLAGGGVRVVDDGRGIPVDEHPIEKIPAITLVLTSLHAGGKFGGGGYKVSGGLHGVGVSVVNALSVRLDVEVKRDGYRWTQSFTYGVPDGPLERHEETDETGTTTTFWASDDIFETTVYSFETLAGRFREMAFLNKGLEIVVRDERAGAEEIGEAVEDATSSDDAGEAVEGAATRAGVRTAGMERRFRYDGGLVDYVNHLNA
ncbi:MAG: ATP-binding protein, partial [Nocardioidaceae bacterium]